MIFINLPVTDLGGSIAFYEGIGATREPKFSNEAAAMMVISETIHVMLLTHPFYSGFTAKPIANAHATSQVFLCLSRDSREAVDEIVARCEGRGVIANANDNAPGQIVVSGDVEVLRESAADFKAAGARVMDLPVGGAFHSALMAEGARAFAPLLDAAPFADARVPLVSNFTATPGRDAATLKAALHPQITGRVRWRESVEAMVAAGADTFVEVGPGKVLSGLVQRCTKGRPVTVLNVEDPASLEKTLEAIEGRGQRAEGRG